MRRTWKVLSTTWLVGSANTKNALATVAKCCSLKFQSFSRDTVSTQKIIISTTTIVQIESHSDKQQSSISQCNHEKQFVRMAIEKMIDKTGLDWTL